MPLDNVQPVFRRNLLEKVTLENFFRLQSQEEAVGKDAARIGNQSAANVFSRQAQSPVIFRKQAGDRFEETATDPRRQSVVESKVLVARVALVAGKEFIAAIS